jgi:hypothetical protein
MKLSIKKKLKTLAMQKKQGQNLIKKLIESEIIKKITL